MRLSLNCVTGNTDHLYKRIQQSIATSTSISMIVSFLMESGVKLLANDLKEAKNRNIPIKILTGNYLNITQPSALYLLKDLLGDNVDLRFYNDTSRSFHAKAYIFEKDDKGEIFIGSSNLSKSALTDGIEWNYRIDKEVSPDDFKYFKDMFDELFLNESIIVNDEELKNYSKSWKKPRLNIRESSKVDINYIYEEKNNVVNLFEPREAQIEALYHLKKTRLEGNDKALIVAATGVGKTYISAFDSKEFNRVLFVAHRTEILKQAYESFKNVRTDKIKPVHTISMDKVADSEKYELKINSNNYSQNAEYNLGFFMNSIKDTDKDIIFASVNTLGKDKYLNEKYFKKDYFDYIVIDEFHHAVCKN
ncbi:MAG: DEAD/DEAH box helicase family protein, partial [Intestinibacter sp.]